MSETPSAEEKVTSHARLAITTATVAMRLRLKLFVGRSKKPMVWPTAGAAMSVLLVISRIASELVTTDACTASPGTYGGHCTRSVQPRALESHVTPIAMVRFCARMVGTVIVQSAAKVLRRSASTSARCTPLGMREATASGRSVNGTLVEPPPIHPATANAFSTGTLAVFCAVATICALLPAAFGFVCAAMMRSCSSCSVSATAPPVRPTSAPVPSFCARTRAVSDTPGGGDSKVSTASASRLVSGPVSMPMSGIGSPSR